MSAMFTILTTSTDLSETVSLERTIQKRTVWREPGNRDVPVENIPMFFSTLLLVLAPTFSQNHQLPA